MKRIFMLFVIIFVFSGALAEEYYDFSSMTNEELQAVIEGATAELDNREKSNNNVVDLQTGGKVLDWNGVSISFDSGYQITQYGNHGTPENYLEIFGIVENNSDIPVDIWSGDIAINGWEISCAINDMDWMGANVLPHR